PTSTTRRIALMESVIGASWQVDLGETKESVPRACHVGVSQNSVGSNRRWLPKKNRCNSIRWRKKRPSAIDSGQKEQLGRNISFSSSAYKYRDERRYRDLAGRGLTFYHAWWDRESSCSRTVRSPNGPASNRACTRTRSPIATSGVCAAKRCRDCPCTGWMKSSL